MLILSEALELQDRHIYLADAGIFLCPAVELQPHSENIPWN